MIKKCEYCNEKIKNPTSNGQKYHRKCFQKNRKEYRIKYFKRNKEYFRKKDRIRYENGRDNINYTKQRTKALKKYNKKNPEKIHAQRIASKIALEKSCFFCGTKENLQRHHPNYFQPNKIITLCVKCHNKITWGDKIYVNSQTT